MYPISTIVLKIYSLAGAKNSIDMLVNGICRLIEPHNLVPQDIIQNEDEIRRFEHIRNLLDELIAEINQKNPQQKIQKVDLSFIRPFDKTIDAGIYAQASFYYKTIAINHNYLKQSIEDQHTDGEIKAVLAHEIGHLYYDHTIQKDVVNALEYAMLGVFYYSVMFFEINQIMPIFVASIMFGVLSTLAQQAFSRMLEYQADQFSAEYTNYNDLITSLNKIMAYASSKNIQQTSKLNATIATFVPSLFKSHPSIEERQKALEKLHLAPTGMFHR